MPQRAAVLQKILLTRPGTDQDELRVSMNKGHVGLLLAAGLSRRFGSDKRQAGLPGGVSILRQSVQRYAAVLDDVLVVLRPQDDSEQLLDEISGLRVTRAPGGGAGMGDSLAAGMAALGDASAVLIGLADKPLLLEDSISMVSKALLTHSLVAPCYQGKQGHPVGFTQPWFPQLAALRGESGARALLNEYRSLCYFIDVKDPGVIIDIDTPVQLAQLGDSKGQTV